MNRPGKVFDLSLEGIDFVVAAADDFPIFVRRASIFRLLPTNEQCACTAVDGNEIRLLFANAPREIDTAQHALFAANEHAHGIFDFQVLNAIALHHLHFSESAEKVTSDVDRVRAVIDQHTSA